MRKKTKREEKLCRAESFSEKVIDMENSANAKEQNNTIKKKKAKSVTIKQEKYIEIDNKVRLDINEEEEKEEPKISS